MTSVDEVTRFYEGGREIDRLSTGIGPLELARTRELITRYLPAASCSIYDVGGAHGVYSFWLASLGHSVHLVDYVPLHIEEARRIASEQDSPKLAGMQVGDARNLSFSDSTADVVILHGPLYHLTNEPDRLLALREAYRVLRPGGLLLAFAISNYASSIVGITRGWVWDADYMSMCENEINTGDHVRPVSWPSLITNAYFHHPRALTAEIEDSGFVCEEVLGIHGPAWMVPDSAESWNDPARREVMLHIARLTEKEPALSPHMMAVARKRVP